MTLVFDTVTYSDRLVIVMANLVSSDRSISLLKQKNNLFCHVYICG